LVEDGTTVNLVKYLRQLGECLFHTKALKLHDTTFRDLFGVLLDLDEAKIMWCRAGESENEINAESIQKLSICWDFYQVNEYCKILNGAGCSLGHKEICEESFKSFKYFCECMLTIAVASK